MHPGQSCRVAHCGRRKGKLAAPVGPLDRRWGASDPARRFRLPRSGCPLRPADFFSRPQGACDPSCQTKVCTTKSCFLCAARRFAHRRARGDSRVSACAARTRAIVACPWNHAQVAAKAHWVTGSPFDSFPEAACGCGASPCPWTPPDRASSPSDPPTGYGYSGRNRCGLPR